MGFTEKLRNLLHADYTQMKTPGGEQMFEDRDDFFNTVKDQVTGLANYFNAVIDHVTTIEVASAAAMDTGRYQAEVSSADRARNSAHNAAISNLSILNRICDGVGVEPICDVDLTNRSAVTQFVFEACTDLFWSDMERDRAHSFDEYMYDGHEFNDRARPLASRDVDAGLDKIEQDALREEDFSVGTSTDGAIMVDEDEFEKAQGSRDPGDDNNGGGGASSAAARDNDERDDNEHDENSEISTPSTYEDWQPGDD